MQPPLITKRNAKDLTPEAVCCNHPVGFFFWVESNALKVFACSPSWYSVFSTVTPWIADRVLLPEYQQHPSCERGWGSSCGTPVGTVGSERLPPRQPAQEPTRLSERVDEKYTNKYSNRTRKSNHCTVWSQSGEQVQTVEAWNQWGQMHRGS